MELNSHEGKYPLHNPEPDDDYEFCPKCRECMYDCGCWEPDPDDERERMQEQAERTWERFA
jgi:hypothetical protein